MVNQSNGYTKKPPFIRMSILHICRTNLTTSLLMLRGLISDILIRASELANRRSNACHPSNLTIHVRPLYAFSITRGMAHISICTSAICFRTETSAIYFVQQAEIKIDHWLARISARSATDPFSPFLSPSLPPFSSISLFPSRRISRLLDR